MSKLLSVVSAVARPENLGEVAQSLHIASRGTGLTVRWVIGLDLDQTAVGGQAIKNELLDTIDKGWVWFLDDDTLVHPDLFHEIEFHPDADLIVVSQKRGNDLVMDALAKNMQVGMVDIGQVVFSRSAIGRDRIPLVHHGDGQFIQRLVPKCKNVAYVNRVLSFYNALRIEHWV